jgi:cytohesin
VQKMMNRVHRIRNFALIGLPILAICIAYVWVDQAQKVRDYDLLAASTAGNKEVVEKLIRDGAGVNNRFGGDGETPLHRAATAGRTEVVALLLKEQADPNIADADGATPLLGASYEGHAEVVELLLKAGADPNKAEGRYGTTPLIVAAWKGHASTVRALLEGGADPSKASKDGNTALSRARAEGHSEILQLLEPKRNHT